MPYYKNAQPEDDILMPDPSWQPTYWTPMKSKSTLGDDICDFIENFLTPTRLFTKDWEVLAWQRWLLRHMFEVNSFGLLRYKVFVFEIPRKNGKSFLASAMLLYMLIHAQDGDELYCAATTEKQAFIVFDEVTKNISRNALLKRILDVRAKSIKHNLNKSKLALLTFSAGANHGSGPLMTVGDEMHAWDGPVGDGKRGRDQFAALTTGNKDRPESLFVGITTAGSNLNGIAYQNHEYGIAVATGKIEDDSFGFACWMAEDQDDIYDPETWRKANPNLTAGLMKDQDFIDDLKKAEIGGSGDFERYALNKWVKFNDKEQFINPVYFEKAYKDLPKIPYGSEIVLGFDGSEVSDATCFVAIDLLTGLIEVLWIKEKQPGQTDFFVEQDDVEEAAKFIFENYKVKKMNADASRYQGFISRLIRKHGKGIVRDVPQSSKRMAPIAGRFRQDFYSGEIFHNGDATIQRHFMNAVESHYGVPRKESDKSNNKIDVLVAALLANNARFEIIDREERQAAQSANAGYPF